MRNTCIGLVATLLMLLAALGGAAHAHPGHAVFPGFWSGVLHPMSGLDHLLAMVVVGLWSALRDRRDGAGSVLELPMLFVGAAALGTALGLAGAFDIRIEAAVAVSMVLLGLTLLHGVRGAGPVSMILVGTSGLLHGGAHGHQLGDATGLAATIGFLVGTATLHAFGAAVGSLLPRARGRFALAGAGGGLAAAGLWLLA